MPADFNIRTILVAPLDWGLGHATRCIPIIRSLTNLGYRVLIATDGHPESLLKNEFPQHHFLKLPGYQIRYSRSRGWLPYKIIQQIPALLRIVQQEHRWLQDVIEQYDIDLVIADNRYGLWTDKIPTVFITHQLTIKAPYTWLEKQIQKINYRYINRFTVCWVPDLKEHGGLAGILSHPVKLPDIPLEYLGLLTRFHGKREAQGNRITVLLSGPEPQRTLLENKIIEQATKYEQPITLVRGLPATKTLLPVSALIQQFNHLETKELENILHESELVIVRSGYTSLMELMQLKVKTVLVPTPGQTEQEYLAKTLNEKGFAVCMTQEAFNLQQAILLSRSHHYHFPPVVLYDLEKMKEQMASVAVYWNSKQGKDKKKYF